MVTWRTVAAIGLLATLVASDTITSATSAGGTEATGSALAKAREALLQPSDLPNGWTSTKPSSSNSGIPGATELATCLGMPVSEVQNNPPSVSSPEFVNGPLSVDDKVKVFRNSTAAKNDIDSGANAKAPTCLTLVLNSPRYKAQFANEIGKGVQVGKVFVALSPASEFAPHGVNLYYSIPISGNGKTVKVVVTILTYVHGIYEQVLGFTSMNYFFPTSLELQLSTIAARRLKRLS